MIDASIAVLDYGIGNLRSAHKALQHLGAPAVLTADPGVVARAAGVVLPGVGAFGACMHALRQRDLESAVVDAASDGRPFLGICVGMQMLFDGSDEAPGVGGLGVVAGRVERMPGPVKLPQMGWNTLEASPESCLLAGLPDPAWCYFVHSYAAVPADERVVAGRSDYGGPFVAAVERGSLWATQFHPEKSGAVGLGILANFVRTCEA